MAYYFIPDKYRSKQLLDRCHCCQTRFAILPVISQHPKVRWKHLVGFSRLLSIWPRKGHRWLAGPSWRAQKTGWCLSIWITSAQSLWTAFRVRETKWRVSESFPFGAWYLSHITTITHTCGPLSQEMKITIPIDLASSIMSAQEEWLKQWVRRERITS